MELAGLAVDVETFHRMAKSLQAQVDDLEKEIHRLAGQTFAIGSTKQLQEVLFDKLKIPANKKTKTGYSTGAEVLEELAGEYPIVGKVLQHRELVKLKNYLRRGHARARSSRHRPHPHHAQPDGRGHGKAQFVKPQPSKHSGPHRDRARDTPGLYRRARHDAGVRRLLADRVAHFCPRHQGPALVEAFGSGEDIHKYTAGKMYSVPVDKVTTDMRRAAKTVNYAVIYGISEFALGRRLGISMKDAKELKTSYFERFPRRAQVSGRDDCYRARQGLRANAVWPPPLHSRHFFARVPVPAGRRARRRQHADSGLVRRHHEGRHDQRVRDDERSGLRAKMLLQVHDELLFECPPNEVNALAAQVRKEMENAYPLTVALEVEVKTGKTWADVTPVEDMAAPTAKRPGRAGRSMRRERHGLSTRTRRPKTAHRGLPPDDARAEDAEFGRDVPCAPAARARDIRRRHPQPVSPKFRMRCRALFGAGPDAPRHDWDPDTARLLM
jgi:DNA polymerase-1